MVERNTLVVTILIVTIALVAGYAVGPFSAPIELATTTITQTETKTTALKATPITFNALLSDNKVTITQASSQTIKLTIFSQETAEFDVFVVKPEIIFFVGRNTSDLLPDGLTVDISKSRVSADSESQREIDIVISADSLIKGSYELKLVVSTVDSNLSMSHPIFVTIV